jgi:uncharacterized membrane protein (DUF2068 family)
VTTEEIPHATKPGQGSSKRRTLRVIASFAAVKGVTALAASVCLVSLLHHDLRHVAEALIGHIGLDPGAHYPAIFLHGIDVLCDTNIRSLMLAASGYVLVRGVEAYGLWNERTWGEWLGALSGMLYVPFEARHLVLRPTAESVIVLAVNLLVVGYLGWQLWRQRNGSVA